MRPFLGRRRWLWLAAACLLVLSVAGVVLLFIEGPDGSEEAFQLIQRDMTLEQACEILDLPVPPGTKERRENRKRYPEVGASLEGLVILEKPFRHHELIIATYYETVGEKYLIAHPRWWDPLLAYWKRFQAVLASSDAPVTV